MTLVEGCTAGLVSLVITVYNREQWIGAAIESILAQTHHHFELVVWDDGSTDRTLAMAQSYAHRDPRVRVVAATHQGRVRALQAAIVQTSGEFLGWVDSDDQLASTALAQTVAVLQSQPEIGMVYTDYLDVDEADRVLGYGQRCRIPYSKERLLLDFMTFHFRLIRRSIFAQVGGLTDSLDFVEDYDLCLRLSEVTQIHHLPEPLYRYRHHGTNASQQWRLEQVLRSQTVIQRALQRRGLDRQYALRVELPVGRFWLQRRSRSVPARLPQRAVAAIGPLLLALSITDLLPTHLAQAQSITPANDSTNTQVTPNGNRFDISGGTRSGDGANLFHSFQQFGLSTNQIANFLATPQIRNILGRVTGGDASVINGLIQVTGGTANLYLMNPAGIVFGPNASLNVPGAFTATTATGIGLGNQWFSAIGTNDYATLLGDPTAFAFTVAQPGAIVNAGTLTINPGQALSLVGGSVVNTGLLTAPGGQINLVGVPGSTLVKLTQPGSLLSFEFAPIASLEPTTDATLPNAWTLPIATLPALLTGGNLQDATGIRVNADGTVRLVTVPQSVITVAPGTTIASGTLNASAPAAGTTPTAGIVQVLGDRVALVGATLNASANGDAGTVRIGGGDRGQGTIPNATNTVVDFSSTITANSLLNGNGGHVTVWSDDLTQFFGTVQAQGGPTAGNGGTVEVSSKNQLSYRGLVDTSAPNGTVGTLLLDPANITIVPGSGYGSADAQLPAIFSTDFGTDSVTISQNALEGTVGDVILEATNDITIQPMDGGVLTFNGEAASVTFRADADGNGVGNFVMATGDTIKTTPGPENPATLTISGANLTIGNLDTSAETTSGGNVTLTATGNATIGTINTSAGSGYGYSYVGGNVAITAGGTLTVGSITTVASSDAGRVTLTATNNLTTGDISTDAGNGSGDGPAGAGGPISLTSTTGSITTGNLFTVGFANSGNVDLTATNGDIVFGWINASTPDLRIQPGNVTITSGGLVRGTGTFSADNGLTTISTASGTGGTIFIQHDGGARLIPFVVGNALTNGTAGAIAASTTDTGQILSPTQSFAGNVTQGNITIRTSSPPPTPTPTPSPSPTPTPSPSPTPLPQTDVTEVLTNTPAPDLPPITLPTQNPVFEAATIDPNPEQDATTEFAAYLNLPPFAPNNTDAADILAQIGEATGVKPALVYAAFVPPNVATQLPTERVAQAKSLAPTPQRPDKPTRDRRRSLSPIFPGRPALQQLAQQSQSIANDNDRLELIMVTAKGKPVRRLVPGATRAQVLKTVRAFLGEVSDPRKVRTTTYLKPAQQLYRWLVAPIEPELQARGINNLAYISDTGLRFLPLSALHDGQHFLVEKYSVGLMPSLSLTDTRFVSLKKARVLAMGASEFPDQPPLPAVPTELAIITKQIWPGTELLNQSFTLNNLKTERQQDSFQIIHLATHGEFQPGALRNSYIQLWDTRLRLDQLRQLGWNNPPVELLVLSACRTALGSDEAELGFAGLAVQAGVKSAIASLWSVSDEGTLGLMTEFYRQLQTAPIKAEALRQAQIAMLEGHVQIHGSQLQVSRGDNVPLPPALTSTGTYPLSHPYYWAAFTLIGSPW